MPDDQTVLETLIKSMVRNPETVRTERSVDEMGVLLRLWVHRSDMGLIVGKRGTHASAIKLVMKLVGFNTGSRISLKIEEPT